MAVIGFVGGFVLGLATIYTLTLSILVPRFTDARTFEEAVDTWVGILAFILVLAFSVFFAWWAANGFPNKKLRL